VKSLADPELRRRLLKKVQTAVDKYQSRKYQMHVVEILEDDDWYHAVVESTDHRRDNEFYDALSSAEQDLESTETEHHFLLVPVIAG
jgi:hypothetical protein